MRTVTVTAMDTATAVNRFMGPCKMGTLQKYVTLCNSDESAELFGYRPESCKCSTIFTSMRRIGILLLVVSASSPLRAQTKAPSAAQVPSAELSGPPASTPSLRIVPLVELTERHTDNVGQATSTPAKNDWITDAAAGLRIEYRGARANVQFDYRVNRLFHDKFTNLDTTQHLLNSNASLEAVEKWLFLDASARITQENRSAFGVSNIAGITGTSANRVEATSYQFAPYIRGSIGDVATYLLRVNATETRTGESAFPASRTYQWTSFVKNQPSAGRLGWSVNGGLLSIDKSAVDKRKDSRLAATATFEVDAQLHISLSAGKESSDFDGLGKHTTNMRGLGFEWSPSERTIMAAVTQKRFFGNDHLVSIAHRTPLTIWHFSSSKEVAISTDGAATSNPFSVNNLLLDLLASSIPDRKSRAEEAQRRLEQTGIPVSSGIQSGFLTSRPFLSFQQDASAALLGLRNTITITAGRREQRAIDSNVVTLGGALPIEQYNQFNANIAWAYRLTPLSTLNWVLSRAHTDGVFADNRSTTQRFVSLFFVTRLGQYTSLSIGSQRVLIDSNVTDSRHENAFASTLSVRF